VHIHPLDLERVGVADGGSVSIIGQRTAVVMIATADEAILRGTAWVPFNQPGCAIGDLIDGSAAVTDVRIERL
jgi:anaerobic selenocysteine-containing dehydrogenase